MKLIFQVAIFTIFLSHSAYGIFSAFELLTPKSGSVHDDYQPWVCETWNQPDILTIFIPFHKGQKKYWLVSATHALNDEQLNFRPLITASYTPIPKHIVSIVPLSPNLDDHGKPVQGGFLTFRIRRENLPKFYVYHDFSVGVDDGGYYRTYKLSSYPIGKSIDSARTDAMEASRLKRLKNDAETLLRRKKESENPWWKESKGEQDAADQEPARHELKTE